MQVDVYAGIELTDPKEKNSFTALLLSTKTS